MSVLDMALKNLENSQNSKTPANEYPVYDNKRSNCETPVMLELWGMQSTHWLLVLPGLLWPEVVAPEMVLSMGQIELFDI